MLYHLRFPCLIWIADYSEPPKFQVHSTKLLKGPRAFFADLSGDAPGLMGDLAIGGAPESLICVGIMALGSRGLAAEVRKLEYLD